MDFDKVFEFLVEALRLSRTRRTGQFGPRGQATGGAAGRHVRRASGRAHSVPRPAFGGAMLTLLRVRRVARLRRRPEARRRVPPAPKCGLLAAFFLRSPSGLNYA
jgi:hypothetical protein